MRQVAYEHAQAETRGERQPFGQLHAAAFRAMRDLAAQELQRRGVHAAHKADERDDQQQHKRHDRGHDEDARVPRGVVRGKAIRVVVQALHGQHEQRVPYDVAQHGTGHAHERRQRHVVRHELALAPTTRQQRSDNRAFRLDRGVGEHHEHERHDDDEHEEQDLPHHLVALRVVERVGHGLVACVIHEIGHDFALVGEHLHHVALEIGAVG